MARSEILSCIDDALEGPEFDTGMLDGHFFRTNSSTIFSISLFGKFLQTSICLMRSFAAFNSSQVEQMLYARCKKAFITVIL